MVTKSIIFILVLLMVITAGCGSGGVFVPAKVITTIVKDSGAPVSVVRLTIEKPNGETDVRYTDSDGDVGYSPNGGNGDYTITPTKDGYSFDPPSKTVTWTGLVSIDLPFEANNDDPGTCPDLTITYDDVVFPALKMAQKDMWEVDDCPLMCDDCYLGQCFNEDWPKIIPDGYGNGNISWNATTSGTSYVTYNNYKVSVNGYTVVLNGKTYTSVGTSSYDGYLKNGSSSTNNDPIVITGDFEGGTVNVTAFRINFNCRQPTDGTMTIACGVETYTDNDIYLDKRWGTFEYGFYEGGKPCAISCKWATNCNCSNTNDQDQFDYCRCKTLDILAACNSICSRFPGLPFCN